MTLLERAQNAVDTAYATAERAFGRSFPRPRVVLCELGRVAGRACYDAGEIRLSRVLLQENETLFLTQTVGHEVAHFVTRALFGAVADGHGREWQSVMVRMGLEPRRFHSYDVGRARKSVRARVVDDV